MDKLVFDAATDINPKTADQPIGNYSRDQQSETLLLAESEINLR
jgi:hypothetical protein